MSEPKFTPGPWIVRPNRDHGDNIFSAHKRIANTYGPMDTPEYLANARLIAASPDLYAACDFVLDWLSTFSMPPTSTIEEKQDAIAVLERAVEKAGGTL